LQFNAHPRLAVIPVFVCAGVGGVVSSASSAKPLHFAFEQLAAHCAAVHFAGFGAGKPSIPAAEAGPALRAAGFPAYELVAKPNANKAAIINLILNMFSTLL